MTMTEQRPLWDEERQEGYVPIPDFPNLRLTPWREEDRINLTRLCNDPRVGTYSFRRPYPYHPSDADWYFTNIRNPINLPALTQIQEYINPTHPLTSKPPVIPWAFGALRYHSKFNSQPDPLRNLGIKDDPFKDLGFQDGDFVGNLHLFPYEKGGLTAEEMMGLQAGEQVWETAYDLMPEFWGKGVGKRMIEAGLGYVRWIGVGKVVAHVQDDNPASGGALRSCGFKRAFSEVWNWPEEKGGGKRTVACWEWTAENKGT